MKRLYCLLIVGFYFISLHASVVHAAGDSDAGKQKSEPCAACHGVGGVSVNPAWPNLAGQGENRRSTHSSVVEGA